MSIRLIRLHCKLAVLQAADSRVAFTPIALFKGGVFILRG